MFQFRSFLQIIAIGLLLSLTCTSCFKDVDLSQTEDIQLTPDIQADIIYYTLTNIDFLDSETNEYSPVIRDTIRLEYLDDSYIQDGLMHAEFRFKHENAFPYDIRSDIKFLNEKNRQQFNVAYVVPAGSPSALSVIDTVHVMDASKIEKVRRSIKMVVELEMLGPGKGLEGELKFSSKGLFRFEF